MFSSRDPEFVMAQCRVWNDWAWEMYADYDDRISPVARDRHAGRRPRGGRGGTGRQDRLLGP